MKLITLTCPKCGAQMEVNPELEAIICNYCGNKMLIDREVVEQKMVNSNPRIPFVTQDSLFVNENPVL